MGSKVKKFSGSVNTKDLYNIGFSFKEDNKKQQNRNGVTITGSDIKDLIDKPGGGKPRLTITKSKSTLDDKANLVPDETKGQTQFEVGKDFLGVKWKKKFKSGGLTKWFNEKWVDISAPKKGGGYKECGRKSASGSNRKYPKCVPAAKASRMTESEKRSAVARKRAAGNVGPKPTNVKTFTKRYYGGMIDI